MLGFPLIPTATFPANASAAAFCQSSNIDSDFDTKLLAFLKHGKSALITSRLARELPQTITEHPNTSIINTHSYTFPDRMPRITHEKLPQEDPQPLARELYAISRDELDTLRKPFLDILEIDIHPPAGISIHLLRDGTCILQNFSDHKWKSDLEPAHIDKKNSSGVDTDSALQPGGLMILHPVK